MYIYTHTHTQMCVYRYAYRFIQIHFCPYFLVFQATCYWLQAKGWSHKWQGSKATHLILSGHNAFVIAQSEAWKLPNKFSKKYIYSQATPKMIAYVRFMPPHSDSSNHSSTALPMTDSLTRAICSGRVPTWHWYTAESAGVTLENLRL